MNEQIDYFRLYYARVRPLYRELFAMALAICGNYERAEYALGRVILQGWLSRRRFKSARGFRESLRADVRNISLGLGASGDEWDGLTVSALGGASADELAVFLSGEDISVRRAVMLKYGCGLCGREIGRALGVSVKQAEQTLVKFQRRALRKMGASRRGHFETRIEEICREYLISGGPEPPDAGAIFRAFEAEAAEESKPSGRVISRAATRVAGIAMLLVLAAMIWLAAAVMRPADIRPDGLMTETLATQAP